MNLRLEQVAAPLRFPAGGQSLCVDWDAAVQTDPANGRSFLQPDYIIQAARDVFLTDDMIRELVAFAPRVSGDEALLAYFWYCRHRILTDATLTDSWEAPWPALDDYLGETAGLLNVLVMLAAFPTSTLADVLEPQGAQVIARHTQDFYAGKPAATLNHFGKGKVIYLGALGDGAYFETVTRWSASLAGINPLLETPAGVEVVERWQGERRLLFVLNHKEQSQNIQLGSSYTSLFDDQTLSSEVLIEPFGVLLLTPQAISQV